jgi:hypothetical protein
MDAERREGGISPQWLSHVSVEDADAVVSRARELGGTIYGEAFDVDEQGRFAMVQDPSGAGLAAWQAGTDIGARRVNDPGCMTWNELQTRALRLGDGGPAGGRQAGLRGHQERRQL